MAPAIKRRKLKHEDKASDSESDTSFAENHPDSGNGEHDADDASMDDLDDLDANEDGISDSGSLGEVDEEMDEEEAPAPPKKQPEAAAKPKDSGKARPAKHADAQLAGGVYTAETFKSNVFKLQVDELLEQVKLRYGKREALSENAMRTLKTIIEQLPSREPQPVRCQPSMLNLV